MKTGTRNSDQIQAVFYVSPHGSDTNDGTSPDRPFQTIERARDAVRAVNREMTGDIIVNLAAGTYTIDRTIRLEQPDSGTNGRHVVYRGPSDRSRPAVISGGRRVTGWQKAEHPRIDNLWQADLGDVDNTRQLFVNGARAPMARSGKLRAEPSKSGEEADMTFANLIERVDSFAEDMPVYEGYKTLPRHKQMAEWENQADIEFAYDVVWTRVILPVERITLAEDAPGAFVKMKMPGFRDAQIKDGVHVAGPDFIQNAFELLGEPGQWYFNRKTRVLYYVPAEGEDMAAAEVIVPVVEKLLEVGGTLDEPVRNIRFEGITFSHTTFLRPRTLGHAEVQANFLKDPAVDVDHTSYLKTPGGIVLDAACGIVFERCIFSGFGAAALDIQHGSRGNIVRGCVFEDIGAGGIQVGDVQIADAHPTDERAIVKDNVITNNYLHEIGAEFKGSIGIFAGYAGGTVISHNEITRVGYSGISVGWGWGFYDPWAEPDTPLHYHPGKYPRFKDPTTCRDNIIEHNHVHHVLDQLVDGGGIYTMSLQPGTVIRENHIHDNGAGRGWPGGIYLDEGSAGMEITGNIVYNVNKAYNVHVTMPAQQAGLNEHDNYFDVKPGDPGFPQDIADRAGLEDAYRDLLD